MNAYLTPADFAPPWAACRDRSYLAGACYNSLRSELLHALATDPQLTVRTPGYGIKCTAAHVVADDLAGDSPALDELLRILSAAARGDDVQLRADAWLAERAASHARFHLDDMVADMEGDE